MRALTTTTREFSSSIRQRKREYDRPYLKYHGNERHLMRGAVSLGVFISLGNAPIARGGAVISILGSREIEGVASPPRRPHRSVFNHRRPHPSSLFPGVSGLVKGKEAYRATPEAAAAWHCGEPRSEISFATKHRRELGAARQPTRSTTPTAAAPRAEAARRAGCINRAGAIEARYWQASPTRTVTGLYNAPTRGRAHGEKARRGGACSSRPAQCGRGAGLDAAIPSAAILAASQRRAENRAIMRARGSKRKQPLIEIIKCEEKCAPVMRIGAAKSPIKNRRRSR